MDNCLDEKCKIYEFSVLTVPQSLHKYCTLKILEDKKEWSVKQKRPYISLWPTCNRTVAGGKQFMNIHFGNDISRNNDCNFLQFFSVDFSVQYQNLIDRRKVSIYSSDEANLMCAIVNF